ncbi:ammonium transporter [Limosilactobacillus reuteri]|uniref:ammonium transporter n=1 Tax=Limosilactobacillus reuteri TaxID=1598 RepID=UPI001F4DBEA8|nr:ammonium transporter [Limosilactobacillus reuteri]MCH9394685.1 ammonium transporter [Limosilactobacillus reuteri]
MGNSWKFNDILMIHVPIDAITKPGIPIGDYAMFMMMFAIITPAIFCGSVVGHGRFNFLVMFTICWSIFVYYPLVHMVWAPHGLLARLGAVDFAGGLVVHVNAGITALILSAWVGRRKDVHSQLNNLSWVLIGTALLWIGWYGFNAGSALAVNDTAVQAMLTTTISCSSAMVTWMLLDRYHFNHVTLAGVCNGAITGLVAITPGAGYVTLGGSMIIGIVGAIVSQYFITKIKPHLPIDDIVDAFGCHGGSGIWGSIATGIFTSHQISHLLPNGLLFGGDLHLLLVQIFVTLLTIIFIGVMDIILIKLLSIVLPVSIDNEKLAAIQSK